MPHCPPHASPPLTFPPHAPPPPTTPPAGECEALDGELKETKAALTELQAERDELAAQLATVEAEAANAQDCLEHARWVWGLRGYCMRPVRRAPDSSPLPQPHSS